MHNYIILYNLVFVLEAKWHSRRKILNSTFHFNILQQFVGTLIEEGNRMTQSLKDSKGIVVKDLIPFISEYTLNAICGKFISCILIIKEIKKAKYHLSLQSK